jgi:hypothetical protein
VHMSTFQLFIFLRSAGSKVKSASMFSSILSGFVDYFRHEPYDAVWHTECEVCGAQLCEGLHLLSFPYLLLLPPFLTQNFFLTKKKMKRIRRHETTGRWQDLGGRGDECSGEDAGKGPTQNAERGIGKRLTLGMHT